MDGIVDQVSIDINMCTTQIPYEFFYLQNT